MEEDVNDYLIRGIHGPKELKPDEKNRYLGTFRERVVLALTQAQVRNKHVYPEVAMKLSRFPDATMLLNGEMEYEALSKYIQLAGQHHITYSKYSDQQHDTDLGLVLALPHAIDGESIWVADNAADKQAEPDAPTNTNPATAKMSRIVKNLFKRNS